LSRQHFLCYASPRVERLVLQLKQHGVEATALSFQKIATSIDQAMSARQFLRTLADFDAVVFTSPNAVDALAPFAQELPDVLAVSSVPQIFAVGPGTLAAVAGQFPLFAVRHPHEHFDADGVEHVLLESQPVRAKIAVVRGKAGREDWIDRLRLRGFDVTLFAVYEAHSTEPHPAAAQAFLSAWQQQLECQVVLSSVNNVQQWCQWTAALGLEQAQLQQRIHAIAIHPKIRRELDQLAYTHTQLIAPGIESLVQALKLRL
jgi:uroporphyrinogen-III synthase